MKKINIVSLFSGCGGLDLGFHLVNDKELKFTTIWANDHFSAAVKTFSKNFNLKIYDNVVKKIESPHILKGDIRKVNFKKVLNQKKVDLIIGGFPCQDFSILRGKNNRKGIIVKRGKLYLEFIKALSDLQPKIFLAENVKGILSVNKGLAFKKIISDFENLQKIKPFHQSNELISGYHIIHKKVVDFSHFGVPQKRQRVIIIGVRKDLITKKDSEKMESTFEKISNSLFKNYPLTSMEVLKGKSFEILNTDYLNTIKSFSKSILKINSDRKKSYLEKIWKTLNLNSITDYFNFYGHPLNKNKIYVEHKKMLKKMSFNSDVKFIKNNNELLKENYHVIQRLKHIPPGENHLFVKGTEYTVKCLMSNIYKRLNPLRPSSTIIALGGGGTWGYHYDINRQKLTNRERARLQTFPDDFLFEGTSTDIRIQIGNAVPPLGIKPFAEIILKIMKKLQEKKLTPIKISI